MCATVLRQKISGQRNEDEKKIGLRGKGRVRFSSHSPHPFILAILIIATPTGKKGRRSKDSLTHSHCNRHERTRGRERRRLLSSRHNGETGFFQKEAVQTCPLAQDGQRLGEAW